MLQLSESKESECVFTQGTPTHSKQSLTLPLVQSNNECSIIIYEAEIPDHNPPDDQILAQVILYDLKFLKTTYRFKWTITI